MAASLYDIKCWFDTAVKKGSTHMIVVCDTYDHEDYPVYCDNEDEARQNAARPGDMQRVMEVYKISLGWEAQSQGRVHNF